MRDVGRGRGVRRRPHAGLVREQAALDAVHHGASREAAGERLRAERLLEHERKGAWHIGQVRDADPHGDQDVADGHDRHDPRGDERYALRAAEDDDRREDDRRDADADVGDVLVFRRDVVVECRGHVVGLQAVESEREAQDERDGEHDAEPPLPQRHLDVVGRAAPERAVGIAHLPHLRKRRLHEGRSRADDGHEPHPEHRARAARGDRGGDADDVSGSHARGGGHHERLERRYLPAAVLLVLGVGRCVLRLPGRHAFEPGRRLAAVDDFGDGLLAGGVALVLGDAFPGQVGEHVLYVADLHEPGPEREPQAREDQQRHQDPGVHEVVDLGGGVYQDGGDCVDGVHMLPFPYMLGSVRHQWCQRGRAAPVAPRRLL